MDDAVTRALRGCVVLVRSCADHRRTGTAFFVGPGLLLTCMHVVDGHRRAEIMWDGTWRKARVTLPALAAAADVSLLRTGVRCGQFARLGRSTAVAHGVRARGFPVRADSPHEDEVTGEIESTDTQHTRQPWKLGARLLKFKQGQVLEGFSGAPLYDVEMRRVVGVVTATRDSSSDLGGVAVPAAIALDGIAAVRHAQAAIDWSPTLWRSPTRAAAEERFLELRLDPDVPFFGRDKALSDLDAWLQSGSSHGLLVSSAGMGKSSLIARWFDRISHGDEVQAGRLHVALVPISIGLQHCREEQVLVPMAQAVQAWHPGALARIFHQ